MVGAEIDAELSLHDPFTVWYAIAYNDPSWKFADQLEDIRIETSGQWTRGMHVIDRRPWAKPREKAVEFYEKVKNFKSSETAADRPGDILGWFNGDKGNRIRRITGTPGEAVLKEELMRRIFS